MRPEPPLGAARVYAPPAAGAADLLAPRSTLFLFARMTVWSSAAFGVPMGLLGGGCWSAIGGLHPEWVVVTILGAGLAFSVPFSALMMLFQHEVAVDMPLADPAAFLPRLAEALKTAGYHPPEPDGPILVSRPTWRAGKASGHIRAALRAGTATLVGPRHYLRKVERALRED